MKALVLSGGSGTRLRPISYAMPKQLVPIAGKPVLEYVLDNIRNLDIKEVAIVVGDWAEEIIDAMGDGSRFGLRLTYIRQEQPLGIAHCVKLARDFLDEDDFVLYLGDIMLDGDLSAQAGHFLHTRPAARIVVRQVPDPRAFGVIELDGEGRVLRLVEKPREPRSDLAAVGVYFFTADVHRAVDAISPSQRGSWRSPTRSSGCWSRACRSRPAATRTTGRTPAGSRTSWSATGGCSVVWRSRCRVRWTRRANWWVRWSSRRAPG